MHCAGTPEIQFGRVPGNIKGHHDFSLEVETLPLERF